MLDRICEAYYLPAWCSVADYKRLFEAEGFKNIKTGESGRGDCREGCWWVVRVHDFVLDHAGITRAVPALWGDRRERGLLDGLAPQRIGLSSWRRFGAE